LPVTRTEIYGTVANSQKTAKIRVFQGENEDTRFNSFVGEFLIEGLAELPAGNQIVVRLDLDLSGILKVTATERATGLAKQVTIDNAMERFRARQRTDAVDRLEAVFDTIDVEHEELKEDIDQEIPGMAVSGPGPSSKHKGEGEQEAMDPSLRTAIEAANLLIAKAEGILPEANPEDAAELRTMLTNLRSAIERRSEVEIHTIIKEIEDIVFYLEDA
jgi:molecular chaperone DnaK